MLEKNTDGNAGFSLARVASHLCVPAHLSERQRAQLQELTDELKEFGARLDQADMTEEFMSTVLDRIEKNLNKSNDILNGGGTYGEEAAGYAFQLILLGQELIGGYCDRLVKATPFQVFKDDAIQERRNNEEEALRRIARVIVETRAETAQQIKRANLKARSARALGSHIKTDAGRSVAEKLLPSFFFKNLREDEIDKNGEMIAAAIDEAERQAQDNLILHSALGDERLKRDAIIREAVKAEEGRLRDELAREFEAGKKTLEDRLQDDRFKEEAQNISASVRQALKVEYERLFAEFRDKKERHFAETLAKYKQSIKEKVSKEFLERVEQLKSVNLKTLDTDLHNRQEAIVAREAAVKQKESEITQLRSEFETLRREVAQLQMARPVYQPPVRETAEEAQKAGAWTNGENGGKRVEAAFHEIIEETNPAIDKMIIADVQTEPATEEPAPSNGGIARPTEKDLDNLFGDITTGISREAAIQAEREIEKGGGQINEYVNSLKQSDQGSEKKREYNIARFARGIIRSLAPLMEETYSENIRDTLFQRGVDLESTKIKEYLNVRIAENLKEGRDTLSGFRQTLNKHLAALLRIEGLDQTVRVTTSSIYQADFSAFVESNFLGTRITKFVDNLMNGEFWLRRNKLSAARCNVLKLSIEYPEASAFKKYKSCVLYIALENLGTSKSEVARIEPKKNIPDDETSRNRRNSFSRASARV